MSQARRGALPAGVLVSQGALSAVQKFLEKGGAVRCRPYRARSVALCRQPKAVFPMSASESTLAELSEWDLLEQSSASDWELLSNFRWAPSTTRDPQSEVEDDALSVASADSQFSITSVCTVHGWPALGPPGQWVALEDGAFASMKEALLHGGGGLEGEKALEMQKGPIPKRMARCFVNGYRPRKMKHLPAIDEELDADQDLMLCDDCCDWWLRKGQGSLLALRRWKYDRRPSSCNEQRREAVGRLEPTWEYESGQSAEGYCIPEEEEPATPWAAAACIGRPAPECQRRCVRWWNWGSSKQRTSWPQTPRAGRCCIMLLVRARAPAWRWFCCSVLQALAKHLAPMHATMGRPVLEDGLITLVQPREMYGLSTGRSRGNIPEVRKGTSFAHIKSLGGSSQVVDEDSEELREL
eukprot:g18484.t1